MLRFIGLWALLALAWAGASHLGYATALSFFLLRPLLLSLSGFFIVLSMQCPSKAKPPNLAYAVTDKFLLIFIAPICGYIVLRLHQHAPLDYFWAPLSIGGAAGITAAEDVSQRMRKKQR